MKTRISLFALALCTTLLTMSATASAQTAKPNTRYNCNSTVVKKEATNALAKHLGYLEPWPTATKAYPRKTYSFVKQGSVTSDGSYVNNSFWNTYMVHGGRKAGLQLVVHKTGGSTGANIIICEYLVPGNTQLDKKNASALTTKSAYKSLRVQHSTIKRFPASNTKKNYITMRHWSLGTSRKYQGQTVKPLFWFVIVESDSYKPLAKYNYNIYLKAKK